MPWPLIVLALLVMSAVLWTVGYRTFARRAVS
jgi:hypothetical protein